MNIFYIFLFLSLIIKESYPVEDIPYRTEPLYIYLDLSSKSKKSESYSVYKVYVFGISVGEVNFLIKDDKIEAKGETYKSLRFLYNYDFVYVEEGNYRALYEKEKDKEKYYENQEIYEKKPWLPILSMFFKSGVSTQTILNSKIMINDAPVLIDLQRKEDENIFNFLPQKSKTKRITVFIKKGESLPYRIDIEGKTNIRLERITQR